MADIEQAIDFIFDAEDAEWRNPNTGGAITSDAGGRTRWGIAEKFNPAAWADGPPSLELARRIYAADYINRYGLGALRDQDVLNSVADCMVNPGPFHGGNIVQQAINKTGGICVNVDGSIGFETITALNGKPPNLFLANLRALRVLHYIHNNPSDLWGGLVRRACR